MDHDNKNNSKCHKINVDHMLVEIFLDIKRERSKKRMKEKQHKEYKAWYDYSYYKVIVGNEY